MSLSFFLNLPVFLNVQENLFLLALTTFFTGVPKPKVSGSVRHFYKTIPSDIELQLLDIPLSRSFQLTSPPNFSYVKTWNMISFKILLLICLIHSNYTVSHNLGTMSSTDAKFTHHYRNNVDRLNSITFIYKDNSSQVCSSSACVYP